jgi:hypothetical protein
VFLRSGMGQSMMYWLWSHRLLWLPWGSASRKPDRAALRKLHSIPSRRSDGSIDSPGTFQKAQAEHLAAEQGTDEGASQHLQQSKYNRCMSPVIAS